MKKVIGFQLFSKGKERPINYPLYTYNGLGSEDMGAKVQLVVPSFNARRVIFDAMCSTINGIRYSPQTRHEREVLYNYYGVSDLQVIINMLEDSNEIFTSRRFRYRTLSGIDNDACVKYEISKMVETAQPARSKDQYQVSSLGWDKELVEIYNNKIFALRKSHAPLLFLEYGNFCSKNPQLLQELYAHEGQIHFLEECGFDMTNYIVQSETGKEEGDENPF